MQILTSLIEENQRVERAFTGTESDVKASTEKEVQEQKDKDKKRKKKESGNFITRNMQLAAKNPSQLQEEKKVYFKQMREQ